MSCPYFYPVRLLSEGGPGGSVLPLGGCWTGECHAAPAGSGIPEEELAARVCNLGYARSRCPRFPAECGPDATRFTVRADDGATVRLYYVQELDHHPFAHGPLDYSRARQALADPPSDRNLRRQAEAYAESYLRRKAAAGDRQS